MSAVTGSFSCDQDWDRHLNARPFVTVVDSIKSAVRGHAGAAVSALWLGRPWRTQCTPGLYGFQTHGELFFLI